MLNQHMNELLVRAIKITGFEGLAETIRLHKQDISGLTPELQKRFYLLATRANMAIVLGESNTGRIIHLGEYDISTANKEQLDYFRIHIEPYLRIN